MDKAAAAMSVSQACTFLADPSLSGVSTADKKRFLTFKGVSAFAMAQAECVAPEDNVQGHPVLPGEAAAPPKAAPTTSDELKAASQLNKMNWRNW